MVDKMEIDMNQIDWPKWPQYGRDEEDAVLRVVRSNQLFADKEVKEFENKYSEYIGCEHVLGVGNATQGLHLSLAALDIGIGDEVIVTPFSFISSASSVLMQNAVPVFCDIEDESLGICPNDFEKKISKRTKAIIVVHMFGYPARILDICRIAKKYNIAVIEDASHAHGAKVDGVNVGTFGDISVLSLHQRKSLSVGDGGVVCTDNKDLHDKIYRLRSFGHQELSYNYRMTEFAAALGKVRLLKIDEDNIVRRNNFLLLKENLNENKKISIRSCRDNEYGVYYAVVIEVLNDDLVEVHDQVEHLKRYGVGIRETFVQPPLHKHTHFNPAEVPARGLPWRFSGYNGVMKEGGYEDLDLPVANRLCSPKILELYVHPPVDRSLTIMAAEAINNIFK